ncbi:NAD(P)/FAD-dependent oxidoreductase [Candidatus Poriferisodalis sp.]|uniref:NAD(P)/FAD-dependent oxidoreductase n=1 Tax=Candidatus Poriferisodalis sp. TaxID=3101277 RepID=UPI003B515639
MTTSADSEPWSLETASTVPLWIDRLDPPIARRSGLDGDLDVDVAIVGGGFSGLWTAYYLKRLEPALRVAVLERHYCGFGASGRNGGWAVGELAGSVGDYAQRSSLAASLLLTRAVFDAVDEIGRVAAAEQIDCDYAKGGTIRVARTRPQAERQATEIAEARKMGLTEDEIRLLDPDEAREHFNATDVRSGILLRPSAVVDPAKLALGLAHAVEASGVEIYEQTCATSIDAGTVQITAQGAAEASTGGVRCEVRAPVIVRATEAYTRDLRGKRRDILPVYSRMIATEPLPAALFDDIGLASRPSFADDRRMVTYGQRTADNRIAFGGTGAPYSFGSRIVPAAESLVSMHRRIWRVLTEMLPQVAEARITHRWGGVLGIPRNWLPGVRFDPRTGEGVLGGYVGEGVAASNLAGRTMAELIAQRETERTNLPWVGVSSRRWEPEPLRWLGVRVSRALLGAADRHELRWDRPDRLASGIARLLRGGH